MKYKFEDQDTLLGYLELFLYEDPYYEDEVLTEIKIILPNGKIKAIDYESDRWGESLFTELENIFLYKISPEKGQVFTLTSPEHAGIRDYFYPVTLYLKIDEYRIISEDVLA